jgi:glutathione S-transferase
MKLYASPTSPFARKVRVTVLEKDLQQRIVECMVDP